MMDQDNNHIGTRDKILVTGASGFIGGHVASYLAEKGLDVTCLIRSSSNIRFIRELPVRMMMGDITDRQSLVRAFSGTDVVIHTAGKVDDWGSYDEFFQANVIGTQNVLEAAFIHSVRRVIITGSVSSYGEEDCDGLKDEASPYNSHYPYFLDRCFPSGMNHYRDTKALCTKKAVEYAVKHGLDLIVIEPVWVYGENEFSTGFYEYLKTLKSGLPLMPGSRSNNFHVVYAGDLARAYYLACNSILKGVHRIIIGNRTSENMAEIYALFCREAGLHEPVFIPKVLAYPAGLLMELAWHAFRMKKPPALTRARVNMFYDSIGYDTSKAHRLLGFEAKTPLTEGVRRTVRWYRDNKSL